jgi:BNR repeat-like domain
MRRSLPVLGTAAAALMLGFATGAAAAPFTADPLVQVSPTNSPFAGADADGPPCNGVPGSAQTGRNYPGTELEPWVAVNPANQTNFIGGWQQDRWTDGGSNALVFANTQDGGKTWQLSSAQPKFSRCAGGTTANGGDYERASDPWVSIAPNGTAYAMSLSFDQAQDLTNAMLVAKSTDGGKTWGPTTTLQRDTSPNVLNDKNSLTADKTDAKYAYAIWDRLEFPNEQAAKQAGEHAVGYRGPTWFSRTTDGGATWEPGHMIYDPGEVNQTIGNQIVQTHSGALIDGFDLIYNFANTHKVRGENVAVLHSTDHGATWSSSPTIIDKLQSAGVKDPTTGQPVRTGDIIPEFAVDPRNNTVYAVWQDSRSTGGARDQVAFAKSTDGGNTWTTSSYAINKAHSTQAFNPAISVLPDGTVGVLYYDFRNDDSGAPLVTSTWLLHSHDGGTTWDETKVGADFDMTGAAVARGYFPGDYMGLGVTAGAFHPFFTRATGSPAAPASNIYATTAH